MVVISFEEYIMACEDFLLKSDSLGETWKSYSDQRYKGGMYLVKKDYKNRNNDNQIKSMPNHEHTDELTADFEKSLLFNTEIEEFDISACHKEENSFILCEYHIVYSLAHSVPCLYFNISHPSGKLLTPEEILLNVPNQHKEQINVNKLDALTQSEHPVLGRPFYMLHPCKTSDIMHQIYKPNSETMKCETIDGKYIISWLSMFGPIVGIDIPLEYFQ